jgi:hypothetical protein
MKNLLLSLIMLLGGCYDYEYQNPNTPADPLPHTEEAITLVWEYLGLSYTEAPTVYWFEGPCIEGVAFVDNKPCHVGAYLWDYNEAWLVVPAIRGLSRSSLAHELMHAKLHLSTGNGDPHHTLVDQWEKIPSIRTLLEQRFPSELE